MPAFIELSSGTQLLVAEDAEAVAQELDRENNAFVRLTRKSRYDEPSTLDGKPVYLRTAHVAAVSPAD